MTRVSVFFAWAVSRKYDVSDLVFFGDINNLIWLYSGVKRMKYPLEGKN